MNKCPTCSSRYPDHHPAVQHEGEVELCLDSFHDMEPKYLKDVLCKARQVIERLAAELNQVREELREAQKNYQFMVDRAANEKLDGYRELGAKCASLEERAESAESKSASLAVQVAELQQRLTK